MVPHGHIYPIVFFDYAAGMCKGIKAELSMVTAHTGIPHSAEAHMRCGKMDNRIVDTA